MIVQLACLAMGTRFELALAGDDEGALRAAGEEALLEIEDCERRLSPFRQDSLLAHVHRCAATAWVRLDADSYALFACAAELWRASDGAFDPTLAPRDATPGRVRGMEHVELDPRRFAVRLRRPGLRFDFGAIAKGQALDLAAAVLRENGITTALLHGGTSSVVAIGTPQGARGFCIALPGGQRVLLADRALGLSAARSARAERGEAHVLDPRTGLPPPVSRVTAVMAPTAMLADAWSTALLVRPSLQRALPPGMQGQVFESKAEQRWPPAAESS